MVAILNFHFTHAVTAFSICRVLKRIHDFTTFCNLVDAWSYSFLPSECRNGILFELMMTLCVVQFLKIWTLKFELIKPFFFTFLVLKTKCYFSILMADKIIGWIFFVLISYWCHRIALTKKPNRFFFCFEINLSLGIFVSSTYLKLECPLPTWSFTKILFFIKIY